MSALACSVVNGRLDNKALLQALNNLNLDVKVVPLSSTATHGMR